MGRHLEFNRQLRSMQVSDYTRQFLNKYKGNTEPYYRALDRLIGDYKLSEVSKLNETIRGLQVANESYLRRLHELENGKQTKLIQ